MSGDSLEAVCDRLSQTVDPAQFERLRWDRTEAPMLARLVELAHTALKDRGDFELVEEGATAIIKRFVVKVHSNRTIAIAITVNGPQVIVSGDNIDRSKYRISDGPPIVADYDMVDEAWMAGTLREIFSRVSI